MKLNDELDVELAIALEKVCFIIFKAREFDAKDEVTEDDAGSNPSDDRNIAVLERHRDDPVLEEIHALIDDLSVDEQIDLVALDWLGRENPSSESWADLRAQAEGAHNEHTADYLCGDPLLGDHLAEGLAALGLSCHEYERAHL
jgi:hypothetical protein